MRQKLQCQEMPLRQIAIAMGITEQDFQSKLKAKDLKVSFVISVSKAINKSVYTLIDDEVSNTLALMDDKDGGKGEVLPEVNYEYKGAPYYNVDFIGGFDLVLNDQTRNPDYYIDFAPYNKEGVIWCNITGHSMEPELNNGDFIAMKEMHDPIEYLPYGEIYGIVTDSYRTVKRIRMADRNGFVRLIPTNKSPEYGEQEIPVKMIRKVYAVLGSMHRLF